MALKMPSHILQDVSTRCIVLSDQAGLEFGSWLTGILSPSTHAHLSATCPETKLRCVEILVLDSSVHGFNDFTVIASLSVWVCLFLELKAVILRFAPLAGAIAALKEVLPHLRVEQSLACYSATCNAAAYVCYANDKR